MLLNVILFLVTWRSVLLEVFYVLQIEVTNLSDSWEIWNDLSLAGLFSALVDTAALKYTGGFGLVILLYHETVPLFLLKLIAYHRVVLIIITLSVFLFGFLIKMWLITDVYSLALNEVFLRSCFLYRHVCSLMIVNLFESWFILVFIELKLLPTLL